MKRKALIHYQPPELYPPVMNFINCWKEYLPDSPLDVYTTHCHAEINSFNPLTDKIKIHRLGARKGKSSGMGKAWHYFRFYFFAVLSLVVRRPATVVYFETLSAFPAYWYKRFINRKSRLFIHYHEYMTPAEYENGMWLARCNHHMEMKLYHDAEWISHTNAARMKRFLEDVGDIPIQNTFTMPNYPPSSWKRERKREIRYPVKAVYIGSMSLDTMYTREFIQWILLQNGHISLDIYSLNITQDAKDYIRKTPGNLVKLYPGVNYSELPEILSKYDLGLILYTGHIPNWVDNAPNKLFEYLSAGLDVWIPANMLGSLPYVTNNTYPKVLPVDFKRLEILDLDLAMDNSGMAFQPLSYYCEQAYLPLLNLLEDRNNAEK
jgi:hypothetical protein